MTLNTMIEIYALYLLSMIANFCSILVSIALRKSHEGSLIHKIAIFV